MVETTISASAWTQDDITEEYTATVTVSGLTENAIVFVDVALGGLATADDRAEALEAWTSGPGAGYSYNSAGSVTFVCDTQPTIDIPVKVVYFDAGIS